MKLTKISYPCLRNAKKFHIAGDRMIFCTGRKARITDRDFNIIKEIDDLYYTYHSSLSPDQTKALLVSMDHLFYIIDIESGTSKKITVKAPYNHNLDGIGCWLSDTEVLIRAVHQHTLLSQLRKYNITNDTYEVVFPEKYKFWYARRIESEGRCMFIASYENLLHLVWYDGKELTDLTVCPHLLAFDYEINEKKRTICCSGIGESVTFDFEGNVLDGDSDDEIKKLVIDDEKSITEKERQKQSIYRRLLGSELASLGFVTTVRLSSDMKYLYVGTATDLLVIDTEQMKIIKKKSFEFGVKRIEELDENTLLLELFNSMACLKIER